MKTNEELNALKEEVKALNEKLAELNDDELKLVTGGNFEDITPFRIHTYNTGMYPNKVGEAYMVLPIAPTNMYIVRFDDGTKYGGMDPMLFEDEFYRL